MSLTSRGYMICALMTLTYMETVLMPCSVISVLCDIAFRGFEQGHEPAASNELSSLHHRLSNGVNVGMSPHLGM